jgi:molybdopterin converting factor subunit 1
MKCTIVAFGISREILGQRQLTLDLPEGQTVGDLKSRLISQYPRLEVLKSLLIAVNQSYVKDSTVLHENDEIALIPPVAGG